MDAKERERQKMMLGLEDEWPHWPILPMKRRVEGQAWPEAGVVAATNKSRVYKVNLHNLRSGRLANVLEGLRYEDYTDVDGLLDAGWRVD